MTRRITVVLYGLLCIIILFSLSPLAAFLNVALGRGLEEASTVPGAAFSNFLAQIPLSTILRSLEFTLLQSLVSTAVAVVIGLPGAWFVARFRFVGRKTAVWRFAAVPFCFPPILVILAFILYYGKEGLLSSVISLLFGPHREYQGFLYSFWGLVMVHAFYNFPIVVHQISALWIRIPETQKEAAQTLGAGPLSAFRTGTLPWLLPGIAQAAGIIFLYCFSALLRSSCSEERLAPRSR